ncbi:protein-tyrosine phosphatase-like protein [Mycena sanguinolenta]|nr:protein-tyrosine phosphatase-like protein [Mycena sanguinolenta]
MFSHSYSPSADEILKDQIYLGNIWAAKSEETKQTCRITHILSVCPELLSTGSKHLVIPVNDSEYDELLIHLPNACRFIEDALAQGGRVLIHCIMGVSRSTTVLAAYLMKTRLLCSTAAISLIKKHRPRVQPNYGFLKQLNTFLECGYSPTATHPVYISWKKKHKRDITHFLNHIIDCVAIIPGALMLCSEFPSEPEQAELLLLDLGVTHFLSLAPAEVTFTPGVLHRHIDVPPDAPDELLIALPNVCDFIRNAVGGGGKVLVYSLLEARACTVVGAYLMSSRNMSSEAATNIVKDALPLFDPTLNFTRALSLFAACKHKPTLDHPAIATHRVGAVWDSSKQTLRGADMPLGTKPQSTAVRNAEVLTRTAAAIMSETGIDMGAFGDTLAAIQQKAQSAAAVA